MQMIKLSEHLSNSISTLKTYGNEELEAAKTTIVSIFQSRLLRIWLQSESHGIRQMI